MPSSLIALAAAKSRSVEIDGASIFVQGISAREIALLAVRFDEVRALLSGGAVDFSAAELFALGPDVVAAIIAAGTGGTIREGRNVVLDEDAIAAAASLGIGPQMMLLDAILTATFPGADGPRPFVAAVAKWLTQFGSAINASVVAPAAASAEAAS